MNAPLKISLVTPSYNQAPFLGKTIRSVLDQHYPNLEYIVMDGGSTDGSAEIIRKYASALTHWESGKDNGQADAIARGFAMATGEILGWINSDDYLTPGSLAAVGNYFAEHPECHLLFGGCVIIRQDGTPVTKYYGAVQDHRSVLCAGQLFYQMSCFWRRDAYEQVGGFDRTLRFCFDYDLFLRLTKLGAPHVVHSILSAYRLHPDSKSSTIWNEVGTKEQKLLREKYGIAAIPAEEREQIEQKAWADLHRAFRENFWRDSYRDPVFFMKAVLSKTRDFLFPRRTENK